MPLRNSVQKKRLDTPIEIYRVSASKGEDYSQTQEDVLVAKVRAYVEYNSRKQVERILGGRQVSIQQVTFRIRAPRTYTIDKASTIKVVDTGDLFDVVSIEKDLGRNQYWAIITEIKE